MAVFLKNVALTEILYKKIYSELVKLHKDPNTDAERRGWAAAIKKLIYCQIRLYDFENAFDNLRLLEEYLSLKGPRTRSNVEDIDKTHELMGEVNYQIFKFPSIAEYTRRAVGSCGICADDRDAINVDAWFPKKPANGSKMSGHRMTYA